MASLAEHQVFCVESRRIYLEDRDANSDAFVWRQTLWDARRSIIAFLRTSAFLSDVSGALQKSGYHSLPLRHFLAPPVSQDQFKMICPEWSKSCEKSGNKLSAPAANAVADVFAIRRSKHLTAWLDRGRAPRLAELSAAIGAIAPLIADQKMKTGSRTGLAARQEASVIELLIERDWTKVQSSLVEISGQLPARTFMHKTRFSSGHAQSKEVDIACGLGKTVVLALECKVTNDETNSVKRIDDVINKTNAWKAKWGAFMKPAALLQGVIKISDVSRLLDNGVEVFWSHRLDLFAEWLDENVS